jgi:guanylate kinase
MSITKPLEKIIVITAPSGAGKTTITKYLMERFPQLSFSISATTRAPRTNETNGKDYYFISSSEFENKIKDDAFIEWEMVYEGTYYGTLKSEINKIWKLSCIPVLDIDVKGALRIKELFPSETLTLFIAPPSIEALKERLLKRGTETTTSLKRRITKAADELSYKENFDHVILNEELETACKRAAEIVQDFLKKNITTNPFITNS